MLCLVRPVEADPTVSSQHRQEYGVSVTMLLIWSICATLAVQGSGHNRTQREV